MVDTGGEDPHLGQPLSAAWDRRVTLQAQHVQCSIQTTGASPSGREQLSSRQVAAIYDIRNPNQVVVWRRNFDQNGADWRRDP